MESAIFTNRPMSLSTAFETNPLNLSYSFTLYSCFTKSNLRSNNAFISTCSVSNIWWIVFQDDVKFPCEDPRFNFSLLWTLSALLVVVFQKCVKWSVHATTNFSYTYITKFSSHKKLHPNNHRIQFGSWNSSNLVVYSSYLADESNWLNLRWKGSKHFYRRTVSYSSTLHFSKYEKNTESFAIEEKHSSMHSWEPVPYLSL